MILTKQEALMILDPDTSASALAEIEYYAGFNGREAVNQTIDDALNIACAAIKAQIESENPHNKMEG